MVKQNAVDAGHLFELPHLAGSRNSWTQIRLRSGTDCQVHSKDSILLPQIGHLFCLDLRNFSEILEIVAAGFVIELWVHPGHPVRSCNSLFMAEEVELKL
jgi:hypothetical protein